MGDRSYNPTARRQAIQRQLMLEGALSVEDLSRRFGASVATIRRDLNRLEEEGLIRRTHGGAAIKAPRGADQAFALREQLDADAKRVIARKALDLIEPDHTLLINDGSTVLALARELVATGMPLMVATPGVNVATLLSESPAIAAYLLGGRVRHRTLGTSGNFAESMLRVINADCAFIAAEGLSLGEGLTYSYEADANLARLMSEQAAKTVVLATSRKLTQRDRITALAASRIDILITECRDHNVIEPFMDAGIEVISASDGHQDVIAI